MKSGRLILLFLSSVVFFQQCSSNTMVKNTWVDQAVATDGKYSDWESANLTVLEDIDLAIGTQNDAENLYVMFRFTDDALANRIAKMGITVWYDEKGKQDKDYGIRYRGSVELNKPGHVRGSEPRSGVDPEMKEKMESMMAKRKIRLPDPGYVFVIKGAEEITLKENSLDGPSAASSSDNGLYVFEFKFPLPAASNVEDKTKICLEFAGMNMDTMPAKREMRGGKGGHRGGGMKGGMGRRGGTRDGGRQPDMKGIEKKEIWLNVKIATADD